MSFKKIFIILALAAAPSLVAQDFGAQIGLGTQVIDEITYQTFSFRPNLKFGEFGVGLDVEVNFQFYESPTSDFGFYPRVADWYLEDGTWQDNLNLYLTKITYLSYGQKRAPFYAKFGLIEDGTLGNGFIMGNYNNGILRPQVRYQGLALDVDGSLFDFPYLGVETFVGNLVDFDVLGGRLFVRPLATSELPLLDQLQIGATAVVDRDAYLHALEEEKPGNVSPVLVYGADFFLPTFDIVVMNNAVFADYVRIEDKSQGGMLGTGGGFLGFMTYGAQLRMLGPGFIPVYFDRTYDISRIEKYSIVKENTDDLEGFVGWYASLGADIADGMFNFNASLEGPFTAVAEALGTGQDNPLAFPRLRATMSFDPQDTGLPVAFSGTYDKAVIQNLSDLVSPENALIQTKLTYIVFPAELSLVYNIRYVPESMRLAGDPQWEITSKLETAISF